MYLMRLADRIARGLKSVPRDRLEQHRTFLRSQQMPDGGFRGRDGDSDLYYTGFALRALAVTGGPEHVDCDRVTNFLRRHDPLQLNTIDLLSWLYSALVVQTSGGADLLESVPNSFADTIADKLESTRTSDGGYAKSELGAAGSTYHSFLVALTYEMLGRMPPFPNRLIQFLYDRQRDDGGFVEIAPMRRSGTNPTAAAVALLQSLNGMHPDIAADVLGFLSDVVSTEGGFQANTRIPFADGLSTFTGLLTCHDLQRPHLIPPARTQHWLTEHVEADTGGFRAAAWDHQPDEEYTFYGLGITALLAGTP
ncbi:MAG: terpene cyclase/mutase family protein [Planctomycetaceae bacterium]|nr:terpene cyclase/mutase family protein [Planctomycetaceae bacterium]